MRAKPCATTRLTLSLVPSAPDPLTYVRGVMPQATGEGQELDPAGPLTTSAWREATTIVDNWTLLTHAVAARRFQHDQASGLVRLDLRARTIRRSLPCVRPSYFTLGPNLLSVLALRS